MTGVQTCALPIVPPPALFSLIKYNMATISREQIAPLHERVKVTVSPSDYNPSYETALKKYAKNANIPGFRKGMVPVGVVKKMHGAAVFTEEVLKLPGSTVKIVYKE